MQYGAACPSSLSSLTMGEIELLVSQIPDSVFFSSSRPSLASHNSIYTASLLKCFAEECMYFSSAFLGVAWMDDSDKENSSEPAQP